MSTEFVGKAVIVTGSSRGIGRAIALAFAKSGASVTIHGQSIEKLNETKAELKKAGVNDAQIVTVVGPIQEEKTAKELVDGTAKAFGRIDILVNNAGIYQLEDQMDTLSMQNFDYLFAVNLRSVVQLTQLAVPHLAKTKGNVINISSICSTMPMMDGAYYGMTKAALDHYTRDLANVLGQRQGIRVNSINPGLIESEGRSRFGIDEEKFQEQFTNSIVAKRFGTAEEVANAVLFVTSPKGSYFVGSNIVVDGGCSIFSFRW